ncbi:Ycf66 family protein [Synechococcus sp. CBW1006]|uniref:Ycf66 family protein n=1 Tax=Synechococcus sp. CBW1006 TaxID=1353138 RepID=UPI0018CF0C91|nr:Ycf66 family protein [Synechococcus sp. CBW1006]QPN68081.1 hypothetical protein H8F26_08370 [Synechococcus sp. CBW1006]
MVNASLNWASIVGIVLAVGGAFLYFMRSFKPALARDYDVFFAAVGLLCGGILFFQGWRLDPILQFGQFLLAGTTVFFAYESVRLRGVTTEQARRSSYFEDEDPIEPSRPRMGGGRDYDDDYDRFDEPQPVRRGIRSRDPDDGDQDDFYRPSRVSRAAIPERAASRRSSGSDQWDNAGPGPDERSGRPPRRAAGDLRGETRGDARGEDDRPPRASRYAAGAPQGDSGSFGARRRQRETTPEPRRGSRPGATDGMPRSSRRPSGSPDTSSWGSSTGVGPAGTPPPRSSAQPGPGSPGPAPGVPQGTSYRSRPGASASVSDAEFTPVRPTEPGPAPGQTTGPTRTNTPSDTSPSRDNSSRFDD